MPKRIQPQPRRRNSRAPEGRQPGLSRLSGFLAALPPRHSCVLLAVLLIAIGGCEPIVPTQFDGGALMSAGTIVVLPLADAPGPDGSGAGKLLRGDLITQMSEIGQFRVINLTTEVFSAMLQKVGCDGRDCYDPSLAAAVAKEMHADLAVCGELLQYGKKKEYSGGRAMLGLFGNSQTTTWHQVSLSLRIVRASDGKIVYTGIGDSQAAEGYSKAASEAAAKAMKSLKEYFQYRRQQARQEGSKT